MPRKKKTDKEIGRFPETIMKEAVKLVVEGGQSVRQAAKQKGLAFQTLSRYVKKYKEDDTVKLCPNYRVNLIFPAELEQLLYDYLVQCSKMFYGLTLLDCRQLAYELAIKNNLNIPESWQTQKLASVDWMKGFRKRFPNLSLRTPEGCSLSRATGFNRFNVDTFFDKLEEVLLRHPNFGNGLRVYNLDETGTLTVQKSSKVLALKGSKQVNKATSAERGTLVTTCCIVNAQGNSIPPVMIFPRVHFKEHMTLGAPNGTLGLATKGGWMNSECFIQVVEHFIKHTSSSKDNPTLLIMDNHESHLSIEVIDLCKANGITILTIPPHCTNKLQPLDVGILKPFHTFYDAAIDSWMMSHPGETFSIYNVASCVGIAYPRAMTPNNITNAFKKCGIFPFDRHTFTADDFLPSSITDREQSASNITQVSKSPGLSGATNTDSLSIPPESSSELPISPDACSILQPSKSPGPSPNPQPFISPTDIRGYPKAKPRKSSNRCGRKGKTRIATDTPEKLELEKKRKLKEIKKKPTKKRLFRAHIEEESDVDEPEPEVVLQDSSGDEAIESFIEEQEQDPVIFFEDLQQEPVPGDYILVEFKSKEKIYYVGEVVSKPDPDSPEFEVKFMRKSSKCFGKFIFPAVQDLAVVPQGDIKTILPKPTAHGSTKRQQAYLSFEINLDSFDVR